MNITEAIEALKKIEKEGKGHYEFIDILYNKFDISNISINDKKEIIILKLK